MFDDFHLPKIREFEDLVKFRPTEAGIHPHEGAKYRYLLDKTENPNMTSPFELKSGDLSLEPGFYEVALSDDRRYLLLIQSRELKALVPAIKVVVRDGTGEYEKRVKEIEAEMTKLKKKRKSTSKLESELRIMKELELSAQIYDSKEGYYVIEYNKFNVHAWGYVPY